MEISKINAYKVSLPFLGEFSHSRKKGYFSSNIVIEVVANGGEIRGYGEGAPRSYVTGESQDSVIESIRCFLQKDSFPWKLNDISQIWDFVDSLPNGKKYNAAICALEMSLLDVLGKSQGVPIVEYFPKDFFVERVYYGAAIPLGNNQRILEMCKLCNNLKINKLRIKLGKDFKQNCYATEMVRMMFGDDCDLRIDVNGAWDRELALKHIQFIKEYKVKVVEQPMIPDNPDIADFASAMKSCGVTLMADELACSLADVERIIKDGHYKMINVRLSKCGGFRNSLKIINYLRKKNLYFQIGCQLGESGLLSAAGRALSLLCGDAAYYDGSYDEYLLKENITLENVSFGLGGEAGPLDGPGLGVRINKENLIRLSNGSPSATIPNPLS